MTQHDTIQKHRDTIQHNAEKNTTQYRTELKTLKGHNKTKHRDTTHDNTSQGQNTETNHISTLHNIAQIHITLNCNTGTQIDTKQDHNTSQHVGNKTNNTET